MTPNTQITPETVGMLKAGDWLMPLDDRLGTVFDSGVAVQFVKASDNGKLVRVSGDTFGPHNWFSSDRFTYHRPAASSPSAVDPCFGEHQPGCDCVIPDQVDAPVPSYLERLAAPTPVDWSVVGPKLVGIVERAIKEAIPDAFILASYTDTQRYKKAQKDLRAWTTDARAALAAATPGGK